MYITYLSRSKRELAKVMSSYSLIKSEWKAHLISEYFTINNLYLSTKDNIEIVASKILYDHF